MPTVILLDNSLSMIRPVVASDYCGESTTILQLAIHGINHFLDYLSSNEKLELVALLTFSSGYEVVSNFTRDFDHIKTLLAKVDEEDRTCLDIGLTGVMNLVMAEWGSTVPCSLVLFTDGSAAGINPRSPNFPLPFPFHAKLHVVCLSQPQDADLPVFHRLVEMAGSPAGSVLTPDPGTISPKSVQTMVQKLADSAYAAYTGKLVCGHMSARISLYPPPQPFNKVTFAESNIINFSDKLDICGFIDFTDLGSAMTVSRHLVSPLPSRKHENKTKSEIVDIEEEADEGKIPSFCVLLHGALKVENVAALCMVGEDWFGVLYSWADNKKKSSLMLAVFEPGPDTIPWLGDLRYASALDEYPPSLALAEPPTFPVCPTEKRSYSQSAIVWIRRGGLQSDIQKILRHARKMPEKTSQFYKELNRLRRAAVFFGFVELLDGLIQILERECMMLPGTAHPECALQMNHCISILRRPHCRELKYCIIPLKTNFQSETE